MAKMPFEAITGRLKGGIRLKRWIIGLLIILLASLLLINSFTIGQFHGVPLAGQVNYIDLKLQEQPSLVTTTTAAPPTTLVPPVESGYLVSTKGCRIPDLSSFESSVARYIDKAKPIICEHGTQLPLIESNNSAVFINPEAKSHYYNESETIDCCWRTFWRTDNKDNEVTVSSDCHPFQESAFVNDEFVRVECVRNKNESIYHDYFAFVPRKLQVEERCKKALRDSVSNNVVRPTSSLPHRKLSLLVIGIDSVSRMNFHRSMPRTVELLKDMDAVEMYGYNKVADNTYPNLVPVLTGLSQDEFERLCWKNHKKTFDRCPFLWKNFQAMGYRTIFGEDACAMTTFNYIKPGFRVQPTDYYLRSYCIAAESDIGNTHRLNADLCLGTRLNFDSLVHYSRKVADEFADDPYFGFFWQSSLTHDYIELPQLGDNSYHELLDYLRRNELLRNTAVVFMSDHGMRWGSFRQTYQGRVEDSLPFIFLLMPDWWKARYPSAWKNLNSNTRRLTTPFDVHETFRDIMDPFRIETKNELAANNPPNNIPEATYPRGISMFKQIPEDRTCESADIPEHWCMCHSHHNVSHDDPNVQKVVGYLALEIKSMLSKHKQCAKLEPIAVTDAKALSDEKSTTTSGSDDNKKDTKIAPWIDYTVTFETMPGNAVFEGSVRFNTDSANMSLIGTISRLNAYGKQSACIDDFHLKLYCYCL